MAKGPPQKTHHVWGNEDTGGTTWYILLFINFFLKAAARRHARFETVTLGQFKESVVTYFSNKRERGKVPQQFCVYFGSSLLKIKNDRNETHVRLL